jgi:pyridinium-3,5-biscarboxylic acid mononucleotide sulfurtransferase
MAPVEALEQVLREIGPLAVAVSGGVDSMTLAHAAHRTLGVGAVVFHSVSAAVPGEATLRVRRHTESTGWLLREIDADELGDERYVSNPVDRCFYCKTDLYGTIGALTDLPIVSGTNIDDLGDYRPGLRAAADNNVRHPYVEAGLDKAAVRSVARAFGLDDLAELPAAPCLASRIETGIRVTPRRLSTVERIEVLVRSRIGGENVRCRIRSTGVVVEVDEPRMATVQAHLGDIRDLLTELGEPGEASIEPYRRGSAFLTDSAREERTA